MKSIEKLDEKITKVPLSTNITPEWDQEPKNSEEVIERIFQIASNEFHSLLKKNRELSFHDGEDIVSQSVLKIYKRLKKHQKSIKAIKAYTKKTMHNVSIDYLKQKKNRKETSVENLIEITISDIKKTKYKKLDEILHPDKHRLQQDFAEMITRYEKKLNLHLNQTEKKVLQILKITHNKKQIAQKIGISLRQISNIFKKIKTIIDTLLEIENEDEDRNEN